jgi:hypothetical protein
MIAIVLLVGFSVGERLQYDAKFSFLNLGTMTLEVKDTLTYEDVHCYHISSVLTSAGGLRWLFSINDTLEVFTSSDDLLPYVFRERINESGYRRTSDLFFDRDSHYVNYNDSLIINTTAETRDILSFWYYLRGVPLQLGDTILVDVHNARENHNVRCIVQKREMVRTKAGDYETILVEPQTEGKGIFGAKGGMQIWYSEEDRIPVQIRASMKFGTVLFKLKEVAN